jgi:hypothetical protein
MKRNKMFFAFVALAGSAISQKRIRVVCQCPEAEWKALKPAFDKIIGTLTRGR